VTDRLVEYLRSKHLLLVVDNCEHVLDAAARLIDALVGGCPHVTVLATSREPAALRRATAFVLVSVVDDRGFEPLTSSVSRKNRSLSMPAHDR
jgi:hypothetical protein